MIATGSWDAAMVSPHRNSSVSAQGSRRAALLVSGDRGTQIAVTTIAQDLGYELWTVTTGTEALRYIRERPVTLILAEVAGAPLGGLGLFGLLRKSAPWSAIPFVLMVEEARRADLEISHPDLPVMLSVPFDAAGLLQAIARAQAPSADTPDSFIV
jgi:CheY-like chemotaxis protein